MIALVGAFATLSAQLLKVDEKIFYNVILLATFLIVLLAIWFRTILDRNKGQKPLYTLITSKAAPKSARQSGSKVQKKADERLKVWRVQANYNRLIALALLVLLLTSLIIIYFQFQNQPRENYKLLQNVYAVVAQHTKDDYEESVTHAKDDKLNVSYWVHYRGISYPVSTTEGGATHRTWGSDKPSIINCAFIQPPRTVQWDETMARPLVLSFNGEPGPDDPRCQYGEQRQRKLKSIACASYTEDTDAEYAVGVCVYTESESKVSDKPIDFIKKRTREFYEALFPLIRDKKLIPR